MGQVEGAGRTEDYAQLQPHYKYNFASFISRWLCLHIIQSYKSIEKCSVKFGERRIRRSFSQIYHQKYNFASFMSRWLLRRGRGGLHIIKSQKSIEKCSVKFGERFGERRISCSFSQIFLYKYHFASIMLRWLLMRGSLHICNTII